MQKDFHYYGTFCAAYLAGYSVRESYEICYSAQLVDWFTKTFIASLGAPSEAATTQVSSELVNARSDLLGLQDTTRMWAAFHFLPRDLYAPVDKGTRRYKNKYRMICGPNGTLVADTVELAKGRSLQAVGIAMHVLADTWAHQHFAGTPSLVINNVGRGVTEIVCDDDGNELCERPITFKHNPGMQDDLEHSVYVNTPYQPTENFIMNLGHGRAGHLPDYSFARYTYLPAWGDYELIVKDNPADYWRAFTQMVHALRYLRGEASSFETDVYDERTVKPWEKRIRSILTVRRLDASDAWRDLGARMSGTMLEEFERGKYAGEYRAAQVDRRESTFLGKFVLASLAQKSMVTNRVYSSGSLLAGRSIEFDGNVRSDLRDYVELVRAYVGGVGRE